MRLKANFGVEGVLICMNVTVVVAGTIEAAHLNINGIAAYSTCVFVICTGIGYRVAIERKFELCIGVLICFAEVTISICAEAYSILSCFSMYAVRPISQSHCDVFTDRTLEVYIAIFGSRLQRGIGCAELQSVGHRCGIEREGVAQIVGAGLRVERLVRACGSHSTVQCATVEVVANRYERTYGMTPVGV